MNKTLLYLAVLLTSLVARAQDLHLQSLSANGRLTWTHSITNGLFSVEWAPSLQEPWRDQWNGLSAFRADSPSNTVAVPMFYRVSCATNLLLPIPVGARFFFRAQDARQNVWTNELHFMAYVTPNAGGGKRYALAELLGPEEMRFMLLHSTDTTGIELDQTTQSDVLAWRLGPVGTTWTNFNYRGGLVLKTTVEAIETVQVGAGTFEGCYKFHKQALNSQDPRPEYYEWIKPGVGMVKWLDYWADPSENPPIVYELVSWSVPAL